MQHSDRNPAIIERMSRLLERRAALATSSSGARRRAGRSVSTSRASSCSCNNSSFLARYTAPSSSRLLERRAALATGISSVARTYYGPSRLLERRAALATLLSGTDTQRLDGVSTSRASSCSCNTALEEERDAVLGSRLLERRAALATSAIGRACIFVRSSRLLERRAALATASFKIFSCHKTLAAVFREPLPAPFGGAPLGPQLWSRREHSRASDLRRPIVTEPLAAS